MVFWKVKSDPFAEARTGRRSLPLFLTILLVGALYYGFSELGYYLYTEIFDAVKKGVLNYQISDELPLLQDFNLIVRSAMFLILGVIGTLYVRLLEGRKLSTMGYHKKGLVSGFFSGLGIAVALMAGILAVFAFAGSFSFQGEAAPHFTTCLLDVLTVFIVGCCFEYFFRGFLLSSLGARCRMIVAVVITALLSAIAHGFYWGYNIFTLYNNFLFDLLLGLLVVRTGNAYVALFGRSFLLFICQFLFGILYSGQAYVYYLIPNTVDYANGSWVGANGIDSGDVFTAVMVIAILLVLFLPKKDPHEGEEEQKPFFQHVPVDKKPEEKSAEASAEKPAAAPVLRRPASLNTETKEVAEAVKPAEAAPVEDADDEENWDEEESRAIVHPEFKNPEQYLK